MLLPRYFLKKQDDGSFFSFIPHQLRWPCGWLRFKNVPAHLVNFVCLFPNEKNSVTIGQASTPTVSGFAWGAWRGWTFVLCYFYLSGCHVHVTNRNGKCNVYLVDRVFWGGFSLSFSFLPQLDLKWPSFRIDVKDVQECPTTCASSTKTAGISITWCLFLVFLFQTFFFKKILVCFAPDSKKKKICFLFNWLDRFTS